jgi:hypothetical protein
MGGSVLSVGTDLFAGKIGNRGCRKGGVCRAAISKDVVKALRATQFEWPAGLGTKDQEAILLDPQKVLRRRRRPRPRFL